MFKDKLKRLASRILYGSAWEEIEREVYMPICPGTEDIPESQCINIYGKPKGIDCGKSLGELNKEIKSLKNDLEQMKIELGNLRLMLKSLIP